MLIELEQTEYQFKRQQIKISPPESDPVVLPKPKFACQNGGFFVITNWSPDSWPHSSKPQNSPNIGTNRLKTSEIYVQKGWKKNYGKCRQEPHKRLSPDIKKHRCYLQL